MAAIILKSPPHCGQYSRSISNTRLSNRAQLMRDGASCAGWAASSPRFCGGSGTIAVRNPAWGASTPWAIRAYWESGRSRPRAPQPARQDRGLPAGAARRRAPRPCAPVQGPRDLEDRRAPVPRRGRAALARAHEGIRRLGGGHGRAPAVGPLSAGGTPRRRRMTGSFVAQ